MNILRIAGVGDIRAAGTRSDRRAALRIAMAGGADLRGLEGRSPTSTALMWPRCRRLEKGGVILSSPRGWLLVFSCFTAFGGIEEVFYRASGVAQNLGQRRGVTVVALRSRDLSARGGDAGFGAGFVPKSFAGGGFWGGVSFSVISNGPPDGEKQGRGVLTVLPKRGRARP